MSTLKHIMHQTLKTIIIAMIVIFTLRTLAEYHAIVTIVALIGAYIGFQHKETITARIQRMKHS